MSVQHLCDGCRKIIKGEVVQAGNGQVRDYCKPCSKIAEDFMNEENALRVQLVSKYSKDRLKVIKKFSTKGFLLPDVVYE